MQRNFRSSVLSGDYDAVPAAIAGFLIIQALCAYSGIGISPDSVVYMSTAQNIHAHRVINDFTNMPVMDFPADGRLRDLKDEFVTFEFDGLGGENIVLPRAEAVAATDDILNDNDIRAQGSPDMLKVWQAKGSH